jgi:hypothetical protein
VSTRLLKGDAVPPERSGDGSFTLRQPQGREDAWSRLSPAEKLEARWAAALKPDTPFVSPEAEAAYRARVTRLKQAWTLDGVPDRVPVCVLSNFFPFLWAGLTPYEAMYDGQLAAEAWLRCNRQLQMDHAAGLFPPPGAALDVIEPRSFSWPSHGLSKRSTCQYNEAEWMLAEEYDELISDPTGFLFEVYLPRIADSLGGFARHGAIGDVLQLCSTPSYLLTWGLPEMEASAKRLSAAGREVLAWLALQSQAIERSRTEGLPLLVGGVASAPFDFVGDTLRGTRQVCMDMYRRPDKLRAAVDKLVPVLLRWLARSTTPQSPPVVVVPLHKGTDRFMSDEQFREFYWPSLREFLKGVRKIGLMAYVLAEGSYTTRLELFTEVEPGTTIWHFDQTDIREAKRVLGGIACVQGNVPLTLLQLGTPEQVSECCRGLIDDVAPGGGYVLDAGAALDEAEDGNVRAMIQAAKDYGVY